MDQTNKEGKIPKDYYSFEDYANENRVLRDGNEITVRFADIPAVLEAAWKLVKFYKALYDQGAFFPGDLKKSIYFHAKTGERMFDDFDKVRKFGGKVYAEDRFHEYRAPELILGETDTYTQETENWTMAVYLYELFYHSGGPFKGFSSMLENFFDQEEEYRWMAEKGIFTMEENLCENRPVHGVQDRLIKYWELYPEELRQCFREIFVEGKKDVSLRKTPKEWQMVLNRLKTQYLMCTCGKKGFVSEFEKTKEGHYRCPVCGKIYYTFESGENRIYLSNDTKLMQWQLNPKDTENNTCIGMVVENKQRKGVFGIKNMTQEEWTGIYPGGEVRPIVPGGGIPLWQGLGITFKEDCVWGIKGETKTESKLPDQPEMTQEERQEGEDNDGCNEA